MEYSGKWHSVFLYLQSNRHVEGISTISSPAYKQTLARDGSPNKCSYEYKRIVLCYYIKQSVSLYKSMDVKMKEDFDYINCIYFLIAISFHIQNYFIEQIYAKYPFDRSNLCHVYPLSLWLANKGTKSFIDASLICSVYQPSVLNPTVNIIALGRINILPRATSQFHFLIKFHCRFHSHDQQQRTSVIENAMLTNDRSANDFQIQWQGCKNESGEYSKYWETHPQFYSNQDN